MTSRRPLPQPQPDVTGLLNDNQLYEIGRIRFGLDKIKELIERVNALALDTGLQLRPVSELSAVLMANDISRIVYSHGQAEDRIRHAAFKAVETEVI